MTVYKLSLSEKFKDKTILLLDQDTKKLMTELGVFGNKRALFGKIVFQKMGISIIYKSRLQ